MVRLGFDTAIQVVAFYVEEGWNYAVRIYRPRSEILDGALDLSDLNPLPD